jgi:hypothetical protein
MSDRPLSLEADQRGVQPNDLFLVVNHRAISLARVIGQHVGRVHDCVLVRENKNGDWFPHAASSFLRGTGRRSMAPRAFRGCFKPNKYRQWIARIKSDEPAVAPVCSRVIPMTHKYDALYLFMLFAVFAGVLWYAIVAPWVERRREGRRGFRIEPKERGSE